MDPGGPGPSDPKRSRRQSGEPALQEDLHFPPIPKFNPPDKLPTLASVIGRIRMLSGGGKHNLDIKSAIVQVTKEVESKYFHDTIYCKSTSQISRQITSTWTNFQEGKRLAKAGRLNLTKAKAYVEMIKNKNTLFDVATDVTERQMLLK